MADSVEVGHVGHAEEPVTFLYLPGTHATQVIPSGPV